MRASIAKASHARRERPGGNPGTTRHTAIHGITKNPRKLLAQFPVCIPSTAHISFPLSLSPSFTIYKYTTPSWQEPYNTTINIMYYIILTILRKRPPPPTPPTQTTLLLTLALSRFASKFSSPVYPTKSLTSMKLFTLPSMSATVGWSGANLHSSSTMNLNACLPF